MAVIITIPVLIYGIEYLHCYHSPCLHVTILSNKLKFVVMGFMEVVIGNVAGVG